jgi:hypothetical protein
MAVILLRHALTATYATRPARSQSQRHDRKRVLTAGRVRHIPSAETGRANRGVCLVQLPVCLHA